MRKIYTSIDLGSDTTKAICCELFNGKLHLLASSTIKSEGIRKGVITNSDLVLSTVTKTISELENDIGIKIEKILVNVPSYFADFDVVRASISVDKKIDGEDIIKVLQTSTKNHIGVNREMLTIIPIDFSVDEQIGLLDPKGRIGKILSVRAVLVTLPKKNIYSVLNVFDRLGIEVSDITINEIGDMYSFKNDEINNKIGALVNIGHNTTTVSLFNKGIIVKNSILQIGGVNITNDLSYIFKLEQNEADKIKNIFAVAKKDFASPNDIIEVNKVKLNQYEISEVLESRLEEILGFVKKEISSLTNKEVSYIIITGGITNLNYFENIAKEVLGDKVTIGNVKLLGLRNNKYSSVIGNMVYYINKLKLKGADSTMVDEQAEMELSIPKNTNETMISKVINFFANE